MQSNHLIGAPFELAHQRNINLLPPGESPLTVFGDISLLEPSKHLTNPIMLGLPALERDAGPLLTLLLAEDNDDLRQIMEWTLEMTGYTVVSCSDAQFASEAFRSRGDIDLLITDLEMPGRSGAELARELTALHPSLPVLVVSGSIPSGGLQREMQAREWKFLAKPYALPDLLDTVRLLLKLVHQQVA